MRKPKTNIDPFPAFEMSINVAEDLLVELTNRLKELKARSNDESNWIGWHEIGCLAKINAGLADLMELAEEANA